MVPDGPEVDMMLAAVGSGRSHNIHEAEGRWGVNSSQVDDS
jgi:hypothetical protein